MLQAKLMLQVVEEPVSLQHQGAYQTTFAGGGLDAFVLN